MLSDVKMNISQYVFLIYRRELTLFVAVLYQGLLFLASSISSNCNFAKISGIDFKHKSRLIVKQGASVGFISFYFVY